MINTKRSALISVLLLLPISLCLLLLFINIMPTLNALATVNKNQQKIRQEPVKIPAYKEKKDLHEIVLIIQDEVKQHHCKIKTITTDLRQSINTNLIISYESALHLLALIKNKLSDIRCSEVSLKKINELAALLLTLNCTSND